ncbi:MAG: site-specific integrase [Acetobacteraceae bacterium]|nr:site-specific integrase [Acetobacteraceae bacterium]
MYSSSIDPLATLPAPQASRPERDAQAGAPPTAADAFAMLRADTSLTAVQRRDRLSALAAVVRICRPVDDGGAKPSPDELQRSAALVPMTCASLTAQLYSRPPIGFGFRSRRHFDNTASHLRAIQRDLGQHDPELPPARDLAPGWRALHAQLTSNRQRGLIAFMGWCSVHAVAPDAVTPETLNAFETWSVERTIHRDPHGRARRTASTWNWASQNVPGWPASRLTRPSMSDHYALPWHAYPASLRDDAERFIAGLASIEEEDDLADAVFDDGDDTDGDITDQASSPPRRLQGGPRRPQTLRTRRNCLKVALAALVADGVAPDSLTSLRDLVQPVERARTVIAFHRRRTWERLVARSGEAAQMPLQKVTSSNLLNIAETLRQVARYHCDLPAVEVARIANWVRQVTPRKQLSMSEKNMQRLGALVQPRPYALLLNLPAKLMHAAALPGQRPRSAALLAMYAVALEILTICPMRRGNLAALRLDRHLRRAQAGAPVSEIFLAGDEVKNGETIHWPLPPDSAQLIETYLRHHRPHLAEPGNPFLFPAGDGHGARLAQSLSDALKAIVERETGAAFNLHLMRHLAVYQFLRAFPGQYEVVRRLLAHRTVATTRAFYAGLEARFAARQFDDLVRQARRDTRLLAGGAVGVRPRAGGRGRC